MFDYGRGSDHLSLDIVNASFVQNSAHSVRRSVPCRVALVF